MTKAFRPAIAATALLVAGCASAPRPAPDHDDVLVSAYVMGSDKHPITGRTLMPNEWSDVVGATCTLANGRGRWTALTPATVRVARSPEPLAYECVMAGYAPARGTAGCFTLRRQRQIGEGLAALQLMAAVPLAIVAAPVAPGIAAYAAVQGAGAGAGIAQSRSSAAADEDACIYRRLDIPMAPEPPRAVTPPRP